MDAIASSTSLFTPSATDWALQQMQTLFFTNGSVFSAAIYSYNMIFAALGGLMLFLFMGKAMVDTAHLGEVLGKVSAVWAPIRIVIAAGLMIPVSQTNGLNSAELMVIQSAKLGIAAGTNIWSAVVSIMPYATITPVPPKARNLAAKLFLIDVCQAVENAVATNGQAPTISIASHVYDSFTVWSADGDRSKGGVAGQCGAVTVTNPDSVVTPEGQVITDTASSVFQAHVDAARTLMTTLAPIASQIAAAEVPPYKVAAASISSSNILPSIQAYETTIGNAATAASATQGNVSSTPASAQQGWATAGAWGVTLSLADVHLSGAVDSLPSVSEPKWDWWKTADADEVKVMRAAMSWWSEVEGKADTDEQQVQFAGDSDSDPLLKAIDPAKMRGLYNFFLDQNKLATDPFGEMVAMGHMILQFFWGTVSVWVLMKIGAFAAGKGWMAVVPGVANLAAAGQGALEGIGVVFWLAMLSLVMAGVTYAYVLPMIPAIYWMFAVARYFMRVMMTVLAAPAWALAHLNMEEGEGFGRRASTGYHLLIELGLRPIVLTLALVVGFKLINTFGALFALTFWPAIQNSLLGHYGGITGFVVYMVMGATVMFTLTTLAFWGINQGVNFVLRIGGFETAEDGAPEADAQHAIRATGTAGHQIGQVASTGVVKAPSERAAGRAASTAAQLKNNNFTGEIRAADNPGGQPGSEE